MSKKKLIIGIGICIALIIVLNIFIKIKENQNSENEILLPEGKLLLSGMSVFSEDYIGEFKTKEIGDKIQELVKTDIPILYTDIRKMEENELKQYYKENDVELKKKFGIQSEDEFVDFANKIKDTKTDLSTCYKLKINKESFETRKENSNYAYVEFDVVFENESTMKFSIYIANQKVMSPQYILNVK